MKTTALTLFLFFCVAQSAFSAVITAVSDGLWSTNATWDLNRKPTDNDEVVIPFGRTVYLRNTPYPKNNFTTRPLLMIKIFGTLDFSDAGSDKLFLDIGSQIEVFANGLIRTNNNSNEIISIHNGSGENAVWNGTPATMNGPLHATSFSSGFLNGVLPVKLLSFDAMKVNHGAVKIFWSTAEEQNSAYFEIQVFDVANNSWNSVGRVNAAGNSNSKLSYSITITPPGRGVLQFRLKQVDIDGSFVYSPIRQVDEIPAKASVWYDAAAKQLHLPDLNNETGIQVSVFNPSGARRMSLAMRLPAYPVSLATLLPGIYIVQLSGSKGFISSKLIHVR